MIDHLIDDIQAGDFKALSRAISITMNDNVSDFKSYETNIGINVPVIGITGPPGAGKSTLTNKLIARYIQDGENVAVICVDPSSPFTNGAILGDRIRMSEWHNHPHVFIRSVATRGSLGGLPQKGEHIIELVKMAPFDVIIVETVGVGQNEVKIASLADVTVVVLVPEAGDDIQFMKAGIMEIGDIFVVNKSDRPGADLFMNDIRLMLHDSSTKEKRVLKTIANTNIGVGELYSAIKERTSNF